MELKCFCLNVTVCVQQDEFGRSVDVDALRQPGQDDLFNGCSLKEMDMDVGGVSMEHSSLVNEQLYGDLRVFTCHSCGLLTHAAHQHKLGRLFVNDELIHDLSKINELRQSKDLSDVFGIVLPPDCSSGFPDVMRLQRNIGSSVSEAQQIVESYIVAEEAAVRAKIQAFVDEQNVVLSRIKQKAQQDLLSLYSVMSSIPVAETRQTEADSPIPVLVSAERPVNSSVFATEHSLSHQHGIAAHDTGIFCMDDLEDHLPLLDRPAFDSDDDEDCDTSTDNSFQSSHGVMPMPRRTLEPDASASGNSAWLLGKSAPVSMPGRHGGRLQEASTAEGTTPSFADIGNSIKAIAQSVQDQSMQLFGELPRPRTATSFIDTVS